jgi:hypothetical protein
MSVTSAKSGATGISLALDNNYMEPIASALVGATSTPVIEFNDIPQTYKHLQVRFHARTDRSTAITDSVYLRPNSDYGLNSAYHILEGTGAVARTSVDAPNSTYWGLNIAPTATAPASAFGGGVIDILDYTNTNKFKTLRSLSGTDQNGAGTIRFLSGLWMNTDAITSLKFMTNFNFVQYTRVSLYGIKG